MKILPVSINLMFVFISDIFIYNFYSLLSPHLLRLQYIKKSSVNATKIDRGRSQIDFVLKSKQKRDLSGISEGKLQFQKGGDFTAC